jgi:hypothetical protein
MARFKVLSAVVAATGLIANSGAAPQSSKHRDAVPAGYALYTSGAFRTT